MEVAETLGGRGQYPMIRPCHAERIVLCIDACDDRLRYPGGPQGGKQFSTFGTIKKCAEAFLHNKSAMNPDHHFSLLTFKGNTCYMGPFNNKAHELVRQLQAMTPNASPDHPVPLSRVFDLVYDKVLKNEEEDEHMPLRIVLFYGRSGMCVMGENVLSRFKNVLVDILYIHRPVLSAKENKRVISNFSELQSCLSEKSFCFASLCESLLALQYTMNLLMHPNIRVPNVNARTE
ncbi:uncharacterized protein LOC117639358 [Thrips palmi]|uniref:BRISC and BRCA1-A complex member 1 n=1 Tax=Thrips palmi TaxID=161013 RepID=A0A6P8Y3D2_THRPL|nr:uncharacterized protein LOC117639358 [Thrips palmi]